MHTKVERAACAKALGRRKESPLHQDSEGTLSL
jgi:hypothetical protein